MVLVKYWSRQADGDTADNAALHLGGLSGGTKQKVRKHGRQRQIRNMQR